MLIITDNEFMEGVFGGLGAVIFLTYLRLIYLKKYMGKKYKKYKLFFLVFITWCLFWWMRKVLVNVYIDIKKKYGIKDKKFGV
jgi:hypothetical protein